MNQRVGSLKRQVRLINSEPNLPKERKQRAMSVYLVMKKFKLQ